MLKQVQKKPAKFVDVKQEHDRMLNLTKSYGKQLNDLKLGVVGAKKDLIDLDDQKFLKNEQIKTLEKKSLKAEKELTSKKNKVDKEGVKLSVLDADVKKKESEVLEKEGALHQADTLQREKIVALKERHDKEMSILASEKAEIEREKEEATLESARKKQESVKLEAKKETLSKAVETSEKAIQGLLRREQMAKKVLEGQDEELQRLRAEELELESLIAEKAQKGEELKIKIEDLKGLKESEKKNIQELIDDKINLGERMKKLDAREAFIKKRFEWAGIPY